MTPETETVDQAAPETGAAESAQTNGKPVNGKPETTRKTKAKAARDEKKAKAPSFKWRTIKFDLPVKLPGVIALDFAEMMAGDDASLSGLRKLIITMVGESQYGVLYRKLADDGDSLDDIADVLMEFVNGVFAAYGVEEGESQASPTP